MKRLFLIFMTLGLTCSSISCNKDDGPNFHFKPLRISSAELPDSFELNQTYSISVTYELPDDCTSFSHPDVTFFDTTSRNVVAWGTVRTDQENCSQDIIEGEATFNFIVRYEEPYVFRFWQGEGTDGEQEFFEVSVPVN